MQYRIRNGDTLLATIGDGNLYSGSADFSGNWFHAHDNWNRDPIGLILWDTMFGLVVIRHGMD